MVGTLDTACLHDLEDEEEDEDQSSLFSFSRNKEKTPTRIAVVSHPNDTGITKATDEFIPELGMPRDELNEFRSLRAQLTEFSDVDEHNKAFERCNLEEKYHRHITNNQGAMLAIREIVDRLLDGEDITLVCFEKAPKKCHRHLLEEHIRQIVDSRRP